MDDSHPVDDGDLRRQSIRGASALMVGQGFRFVISMASQVYLARLLFPADFGLIAMVYPVMGFVQLFADFGLLQAVVQKPKVSQPLLSAVFWINVTISLGLALLFAALSPVLVVIYGEPRVGPISLVLSSLILVSGLGQLQGALLNRQLKFAAIVTIDIVSLAAGFVAAIAGALNGYGYWSLVFSQIASTCTTTILTIILSRWRPSFPRAHPELLSMLHFGSQMTGARVIGYLNGTIDNMMVGVAMGERALGIYDRAWRLAAQPLGQLCAPIDRLAIPVLSRVQDDWERYRRAFGQMIQMLCLMAMPGLLFGVVGADRFIPMLLGPKWIDATPVFAWICFGALISPLNNAAFWLFVSQRRGGDQLKYSLIAALINIAAYAVGLAWGPVGVARASALSVYFLQCPMLIWAGTRSGPVSRSAFLGSVWPVILAITIAAPILYFFVHAMPQDSVVGLLFCVGFGYVLTGAILLGFGAGRKTLATVWNLVPVQFRDRAGRIVPGLGT